jgi:hypothetical protein
MVWGGEKIYLGRWGLIIIITPICAPQRGRDGMDCVGVVWMMCSINSSHHQLGACWHSNMLLGLLGSVFHSKNKYLSLQEFEGPAYCAKFLIPGMWLNVSVS